VKRGIGVWIFPLGAMASAQVEATAGSWRFSLLRSGGEVTVPPGRHDKRRPIVRGPRSVSRTRSTRQGPRGKYGTGRPPP
jgi:hypothetical protein